MKIIQLTAENVKKLTAVEISPDGNVVQITGKNGQGKTSVLDSIWWALAGTENVQAQPIRNGAEAARIEMKIGSGDKVELIVERRFTASGSTLSVMTADGAKYPKPQKMLDDVIGAISLDPLAFMREKPQGQFDMLRGLVALDIDPSEFDRLNVIDYAARTDANRDAKAKRAQAAAIQVVEGLPAEQVDEGALLDAMQKAADENTRIEQRRANREAAKVQIQTLTENADAIEASLEENVQDLIAAGERECSVIQEQIDALRARLAKVKGQIAADAESLRASRLDAIKTARDDAAAKQKKLDEAGELPTLADIAELRASLDAAKTTNRQIFDRDRRITIETEAAKLEAESERLTTQMDERNKAKLDAISKAKMPVDGLSFGDGVVTFNGVPLNQASDAEQLMVSTAIAAALNPKLRVLRIRDGSLLDDDAMIRLAEFANERDFQIWIERVDGSGVVGFVMEDGHVKGQDLTPAEPDAAKKSSSKKKEAA